jgi:hypothetical protein
MYAVINFILRRMYAVINFILRRMYAVIKNTAAKVQVLNSNSIVGRFKKSESHSKD